MAISAEAKKAIKIGSLCSVSYLAVYIARNILGVLTPQMILGTTFTTENIGTLSSVFFITYAIGQLINGIIGDRIKAKYMISIGLFLAGIFNFTFTLFDNTFTVPYISYLLMGFALSMIYGPMTKVVAENNSLIYATRCSVGYNFASLFGSPLAGVLAALFLWHVVFYISGGALIITGVLAFVLFTLFEKQGLVKYNQFKKAEKNGGGIKVLIEREIIRFTLISVLTGIIRTTVVFWLPTYFAQHLGFSTSTSAVLFTVSTLIGSASAFVSIFIYEKMGYKMNLSLVLWFALSAIGFLGAFLFENAVWNVGFIIVAIFAAKCAASMLWSRYCPSLSDTGLVSSATGFLDFMSYMAASISSSLFANAVADIGWSKLVFVWFLLMAAGLLVMVPFKKLLKGRNKGENA